MCEITGYVQFTRQGFDSQWYATPIATARRWMFSVWWKKEMIRTLQRADQFNRIRRAWLGEGGDPVSPDLANQRANICLQCPKNYKGSWLWNQATEWTIAAWSRLRDVMKLHVQGEEGLGVCEVCGCKTKLKIHVPYRHIYRQTTPEMMEKYPSHCWIQKEKPQ